jgi:hypothetical protein
VGARGLVLASVLALALDGLRFRRIRDLRLIHLHIGLRRDHDVRLVSWPLLANDSKEMLSHILKMFLGRDVVLESLGTSKRLGV